MSGSWKNKERLVAGWFGTRRNPLSGRNNVGDDLQRRVGDIIYPFAVVEVKRRKSIGMTMAKETRADGKEAGKPWLHVEFQTGQAQIVKITTSYESASLICSLLDKHWRGGNV